MLNTLMRITQRHERACFCLSVGLPVLDHDLQTLAFMGLIERRGDEWSLTEKGCDVAAGRHERRLP